MAWKETEQEGVFSRHNGENETFTKLLGDAGLPLDREHWAINSLATIVVPTGAIVSADLTAHFRRAWAHLRFQHPSLSAEIPGFLETFSVANDANDANSSADVIKTFRPTPYAKLVYIPRSGELVGHTAHGRSEGLGVVLLLDAFLAIASESSLVDPALLVWGTEAVHLAPAIEYAASAPEESTPELQKHGAAVVAMFAYIVGALAIPYLGDAGTLPAATHAAQITFSKGTTEMIVADCKARGISVTAAVHASVAGAN
ncbi:hypothetical protein GGR54DRAFT_647647 [Hypoxylon sp. NC1633]|nr:hypothetical protein GGR54DRAFT_647647 [Hypoxylon sp. NC1633]